MGAVGASGLKRRRGQAATVAARELPGNEVRQIVRLFLASFRSFVIWQLWRTSQKQRASLMCPRIFPLPKSLTSIRTSADGCSSCWGRVVGRAAGLARWGGFSCRRSAASGADGSGGRGMPLC
ncbi:unnamed protein product [Urochloa humidicola]